MNDSRQEDFEKNVRRTTGLHALRKIGAIVAKEQQDEVDNAKVLSWFVRYGWVAILCAGLLLTYIMGVI